MQIGIVGAGMIGSTVARLWADAGHDVRLASRHPETLKTLVDSLAPEGRRPHLRRPPISGSCQASC
jgi:predicted dinucleotide-binding enzyme